MLPSPTRFHLRFSYGWQTFCLFQSCSDFTTRQRKAQTTPADTGAGFGSVNLSQLALYMARLVCYNSLVQRQLATSNREGIDED